ncbi:MFS transporter [cyanobacterium endosymbiont of Epithemia clementina EcSB]|uniref:MFS transporter n=1 Tax=cyanobacterium endosymbiont of Epithemia clementina EcSB TaxID=3034674 RepID=UPI0024808F1E|nr:MFS transporter [cyanobacterium endosymbiont of Epithemia clementina EcSB]WGT68173.1 MFS transporter [cyanobacterium endosymbiont of Epithemia clementina EcSB]
MTEKKIRNFWQLWNMNVGFFGIQYGWALQMANTSAIYEYLGAEPEQIPMLWLAAPLSGLIAQPIIGYMSDRTWGPLGRRRPYFLLGAIFSSIALILMPNSSSLWMAAGLLWILDTSVNISMEPFRAFIADLLPQKQHTRGFSMQGFFIGAGAVTASLFPWILTHLFHVDDRKELGVPFSVKSSFYIGAAVFLGTVIWTVVTTSETPPKNLEKIRNAQKSKSALDKVTEIFWLIKAMPTTMKQLAVVQFFTWLGIFCVFLYFPPAVAHNIFGAVRENSQLYTDGIEWAGICIAVYNGVCLIFSWLLPKLTEIINHKIAHSLCLICGGVGLISLVFVDQPLLALLPMIGFGIAWSSILAIPYSILSQTVTSQNIGLYMGIFNAFIVIPQIFAALGLGWIMKIFLDSNCLLVVVVGGFSLLLAAMLVHFVDKPETSEKTSIQPEILSPS